MTLDDIPAYLYDEKFERYFLNINKDLHGKWSAGYMNFDNYKLMHWGNNFESLEEIAEYMKREIDDTRRHREG